jgi:beta-glucosidase
MRQAVKNILYVVANSRAYDPDKLETGMMGWQKAAVAIDVVIAVIIIALAAAALKKYKAGEAGDEQDVQETAQNN